MKIVGIDLSGPANTAETSVAAFNFHGSATTYLGRCDECSDGAIVDFISQLSVDGPVVVGLDAPLSYQPGGGDRLRDTDLRRAVMKVGMASGSVMTPTTTRMAYLTLRGISVARNLASLSTTGPIRLVEVHPGATLALRGAPIDLVRSFKTSPVSQDALLAWLGSRGLEGLPTTTGGNSHFLAACACALAALAWDSGAAVWCAPAEHPWHPFDFAC